MFSGHVPEGLCSRIGPRQEFVDAAIGMIVDDLGDDIGQVGVWFDTDELAGLCCPPNYAESGRFLQISR